VTVFDTWESYLYPPPDDKTLRNLVGIRDPQALEQYEYRETRKRGEQLKADPSLIEHTYDADHVRAIHRYLFQDVYEWAGDYRTQNMFKGGRFVPFASVNGGEIDRYLNTTHHIVTTTDWAQLDRDEFSHAAAAVFANLNQAHPFREGNGRTSRVFMDHVAQNSKFDLDYSRVSPKDWNMASMLSGPDLGKYEVVPGSLVPVFQAIATRRAPEVSAPSEASTVMRQMRSKIGEVKKGYAPSPQGQPQKNQQRQTPQQPPYRPKRGYGDRRPGMGL